MLTSSKAASAMFVRFEGMVMEVMPEQLEYLQLIVYQPVLIKTVEK